MEKEEWKVIDAELDLELLNSVTMLEKRIKNIEQLESIKYPTHLKELINDLMDRVDELEFKLANKNYD
jgi:hypothetical protein